jgi:hypothetical protein
VMCLGARLGPPTARSLQQGAGDMLLFTLALATLYRRRRFAH